MGDKTGRRYPRPFYSGIILSVAAFASSVNILVRRDPAALVITVPILIGGVWLIVVGWRARNI